MPNFTSRITKRIKETALKIYGLVRDIRHPEVLMEEDLASRLIPGNKRILYVANKYDYADKNQGLGYDHCHFYHTLMAGKYSVIYFPQDQLKQKHGTRKMSQILREAAYYYQPDILLYYHYLDRIDHKVWKEVSQELPTKTIIMLGDDHVRHEETRPVWQLFNMVVTMDHYAYNKRKKEGFTNVFLSQWGFNHFLYKNLNLPRIYDVSFIGQAYGERPRAIAALRNAGISIQTFGRGWPGGKRISQADLIKIYNQSKISFNHAIALRGNMAINARDFEATGCGSLALTQETEEIINYFVPGKEIVTYGNLKEAVEKIRYYLAHDEERKALARAGHERAMRSHTYEKRFEEIFSFADTIHK